MLLHDPCVTPNCLICQATNELAAVLGKQLDDLLGDVANWQPTGIIQCPATQPPSPAG